MSKYQYWSLFIVGYFLFMILHKLEEIHAHMKGEKPPMDATLSFFAFLATAAATFWIISLFH